MAKKRVVRVRFYLVLMVAVLLAAGGIWYFFAPSGYDTVQQGTIDFEKQVKAVIVRDEETITQDNYGKISFVAAEGEKVAANAKVAEVYAWGYSDKVLQDLISVQTEIKAYQENNILKLVFEKDLQSVNEKIDAHVTTLRSVANGQEDVDPITLENELKTLMQQQKDLLKRACTPDDTLQKLYDREAELEKRLNAWISDVKTEKAGTISFYFDGFEQIMTPEQIDKLTRADIDNIINNAATQKIDVSEGTKPLYRLVNSDKWYLLIAGDGDEQLQTDMVYDIAFEGFFDQPYVGRLLSQRDMDQGVLCVLEINDDIGPLLSVRKANVTLRKTYEGLKVPVNALTEKDGTQGITAVENENDVFIPVQVVYKDNNYAIIESADVNRPLETNTRVRLHH